jgi:hypothetical protein
LDLHIADLPLAVVEPRHQAWTSLAVVHLFLLVLVLIGLRIVARLEPFDSFV